MDRLRERTLRDYYGAKILEIGPLESLDDHAHVPFSNQFANLISTVPFVAFFYVISMDQNEMQGMQYVPISCAACKSRGNHRQSRLKPYLYLLICYIGWLTIQAFQLGDLSLRNSGRNVNVR